MEYFKKFPKLRDESPKFQSAYRVPKRRPHTQTQYGNITNVKAQILKVQKRKSRLSKKNNKIHTDIMHFNMNPRLKRQ